MGVRLSNFASTGEKTKPKHNSIKDMIKRVKEKRKLNESSESIEGSEQSQQTQFLPSNAKKHDELEQLSLASEKVKPKQNSIMNMMNRASMKKKLNESAERIVDSNTH